MMFLVLCCSTSSHRCVSYCFLSPKSDLTRVCDLYTVYAPLSYKSDFLPTYSRPTSWTRHAVIVRVSTPPVPSLRSLLPESCPNNTLGGYYSSLRSSGLTEMIVSTVSSPAIVLLRHLRRIISSLIDSPIFRSDPCIWRRRGIQIPAPTEITQGPLFSLEWRYRSGRYVSASSCSSSLYPYRTTLSYPEFYYIADFPALPRNLMSSDLLLSCSELFSQQKTYQVVL